MLEHDIMKPSDSGVRRIGGAWEKNIEGADGGRKKRKLLPDRTI